MFCKYNFILMIYTFTDVFFYVKMNHYLNVSIWHSLPQHVSFISCRILDHWLPQVLSIVQAHNIDVLTGTPKTGRGVMVTTILVIVPHHRHQRHSFLRCAVCRNNVVDLVGYGLVDSIIPSRYSYYSHHLNSN
jgi:hypothetical protein